MRKDEIRSLVKNSLPKLDKVAKFHDRFIDASVEKVINQLYAESFANDKLSLQKYIKQYGYTVPLTVSLEASTNIYYTTLPAMIVPIDDKASGVRRISTIAQGGFTFFPMDAREHDFMRSGSYVNTVTSKIGYLVNQTRIEYFNMSAAIVAQGVRADLLVPFSVYDDSDTVLIPETTDKNGIPFVDMVIRVLMSLPPTDMLDNNENAKQ
jgi:cell division protein FtsI/penicillin-binding protein 2